MSSQPNQSLIDGIRCFQELTTSSNPLGSKELAERLGINVVRANRLLRTLKSIGMAQQNAQKKYMPGPVVHVLAAQSFHSSALFRHASRVALESVYEDRTLAIGVLWKDSVVYMYHSKPDQSPAAGLVAYDLFNVRHSTIGQALLAEFSDTTFDECLAHWEPDERDRMRAKIVQIRRSGFATRRNDEGIIDSVARVFSVEGAKAGIAFSNLLISDDDLAGYVDELTHLTSKIEACSRRDNHPTQREGG